MTQFLINGLCQGAVCVLVALGFGLIHTAARTFHIAHGAVFTAAAYVCFSLVAQHKWPIVMAATAAVCVGSGLGVGVEAIIYSPLRANRRSSDASMPLLVSSLGFYIALVSLIAAVYGSEARVINPGADRTFAVFDATVTRVQVAQIAAAAILTAALAAFLRISPLGQSFRALADDPELVGALGYDARSLRLYVFALGSGLASLGAVLTTLDVGVDPYVGFDVVLSAAVAVILGGVGSFLAPALGALLLGILQGIVAWQTSSKWSSCVVFAILILVLLLRPAGLFGCVRRAEEM